jgi:putative ABC transport system permease protein
MRAAWRLARSICSARPSRVLLLAAAVAMSTALVSAVACAMASLNAAVRAQLDSAVGTAQARVQPAGRDTMPDRALDIVRGWEGVRQADPKLEQTLALVAKLPTLVQQPDGSWVAEERSYRSSTFVTGVDLDAEFASRPPKLLMGRLPEGPGEVLIDAVLARRLSFAESERLRRGDAFDIFADPVKYLQTDPVELGESAADADTVSGRNAGVGVRIGDTISVVRMFRQRGDLTVVGIAEPAPLGGKPIAMVDIASLGELAGTPGMISSIDIMLEDGVDPELFAERYADELGRNVLVQTTERITSGVEKNLAASQFGLILIGSVSLMCAGFIIMTGLTTGVAEQQKTLAVLRCVGARRTQLGAAQLMVGLFVGVGGAIVGVPLGVAMTWGLSKSFEKELLEGVVVPPVMLSLVLAGSLLAGVLGALWPAWRAASMSPLGALAARGVPPSATGLRRVAAAGLIGIVIQALIVSFVHDSQAFFWSYVSLGLPAMFIGYFLVSVPVIVLIARGIGPAVARALGLPAGLLTRTVAATPYRHGFTAGALMTGLALMVGIWTNGGSALRDWLGKIRFPDAFAYGLPLSDDVPETVAGLPFVERTTAITLVNVDIDGFGVEGLQQYKTSFFGLDYGVISDMFQVEFVEGDPATAAARMEQGGAVLVAREFTSAKGLGLGDEFICRYQDEEHRFEIAGVVTSAGLEFISQYFDFGDSFVNQTIHSVVGSRKDVATKFGVTRPYIVGIQLRPDADEVAAVNQIREATMGMGVLNVGSGRQIREQMEMAFKGTLGVFTTVAIGAMLVACFGVANLIIAEVQSRRFELGVIRAVGGSRGQLVRLVCGQAILIALAASVLGTLLGLQAAWGGQTVNQKLVGIEMHVRPPIGAIAFGWGVAMTMALLSAAPTAWKIARSSPRVLLSAR